MDKDNRRIPELSNRGIDLSKLGQDKDKRSKLERQLENRFRSDDSIHESIILTLEIIWEHIAALGRHLGIPPEDMARMVVDRDKNQAWLTLSAEEEVKLKDIKEMFTHAAQKSASQKDGGESVPPAEAPGSVAKEPEAGDDDARSVERGAVNPPEPDAPRDEHPSPGDQGESQA